MGLQPVRTGTATSVAYNSYMLMFRRSDDDDQPPWAQAPQCAEYRASGLELRLIDLVELRERSARAGFDDVAALDTEIVEVRDELAALSESPLVANPAA